MQAEMFMHVTIQTFKTWLLYIELWITARQQKIHDIQSNDSKFIVLAIMSTHLSWLVMAHHHLQTIYISDLQYDMGGVLYHIRPPIYYIGYAVYK